MKKISIVGIGMGNPDTLTLAGVNRIKESDFVIGAKRITQSVSEYINGDVENCVLSDEIAKAVEQRSAEEKITVLMSGDTGFYSGTKKLIEIFKEKGISYDILPGISSLQYFAAKTGINWDDVKTVSLHGRDENPVSTVLTHLKTFFLLDGNMTAQKVCDCLYKAGLGNLNVIIGERLSYHDEKITYGEAQKLKDEKFEPLGVIMVLNPQARRLKVVTHGISDDNFIRGKVPMTKEEVRTVSISKLGVGKRDVVYDIGAGTGSVSVELARQVFEGRVYAVETNQEALQLVKENTEKFLLQNIEIVQGAAPEALKDLPAPHKVFIGGSKGNMEEIIKVVSEKNPKVKVVINAIALETLSTSLEVLKKYNFTDIQVVQMSVAKAEKVGPYNMMKGQNPVFIISGQGV